VQLPNDHPEKKAIEGTKISKVGKTKFKSSKYLSTG